MKIINFKKRVFKVIFSIALLAVILNITSVPTTSAKFVDEKDPVLVYNETLSGIKIGSFYLYQMPKLDSDTNKLTFSVAVGRSTIGNGNKVSEDYILDFDNKSCIIANVSTNNGDYMISYAANNNNYDINYVEFVCSDVQSSFSVDIQIHEILNNDVRFDNTRGTLTVTYEEETPTITFDTLIDDMLEYLKINLDREDIVKDDVIEYANKKGVTEENPNYKLIPGAIYNETNKSLEFTTDLRDDFAKYMFNKKYEGENYKDSVEYINKALEEDGNPLSDFFKSDYPNKIAYFVSYKDNKIIKIDKNNNITIHEVKDIINDIEVITLYVVADDIGIVNTNDILNEINSYNAKFKEGEKENINNGFSIDYIREHEEQTIDEDLENKESELEIMNQEYYKLLENIKNNTKSPTTKDFIDNLALDNTNPFYQYVLSRDTNPLYYVYYETSPIETETYSLNEQNKIYLTLIEMNDEGITISTLDSKLEEILKENNEIKIYTLDDTSDDIASTLEAMLAEIGFTAYERDESQVNSLVYKITGNYEKVEEDDGEDQEEPDESDNEGTDEEGETPDNTGDDSEKQPEEDNDNITDDSNVDEDNDDSQDINDDNKNNDEENQDSTIDNNQDSSNENLNNDENNEGENTDYSDTGLNNSEYENESPELLNNNEDIILG